MFAESSQFWMGELHATECLEVTDDPSRLNDGSFWAVSISFEGEMRFARFSNISHAKLEIQPWHGLSGTWKSSHSEAEYHDYVSTIRESIAQGGVYQVNACRELHNELLTSNQSLLSLYASIKQKNPAIFACYLKIDELEIASASPERFISRNGVQIKTSPIKGTIRENQDSFGEKDKAENLMIVDLMRNDLGRICDPGSIEVTELFRHEKHPGITHLVSDVEGTLLEGITWEKIFEAIMPPGSVSGAPKSAALKIIAKNEGKRGPYCGTLGWIQGDRAELSVAIRTFWNQGDSILRFGTGAGITWSSEPIAEWDETQLKARHLISIAGGQL
jgi:para-aminobenzoate synthetase component 1